jgi:hypothetical protein
MLQQQPGAQPACMHSAADMALQDILRMMTSL